jgi:hypothetical protein
MSGKLFLSITGLQSEFISKNPTFSHFLSVFKKHTKFAFNTIEIPLVNAKLDEESICIIPVDVGDLINTFTLRYKLFYKASISSGHFGSAGSYDDPFTPNVGIHAIDYAELYIGGTLIEKITSDWIYLYHKYNTAKYIFIDSILYQTQAANRPYGSTSTVDSNGITQHIWNLKQMHIDLPFYFYKNLPASIITCKLSKQDCYVKIKFKPFDKLIHPFLKPYTLDTNIETASLLTKFTFLDRDELDFLKSRPINQLITQTKLHQHDIIRKSGGHDHMTEIPINLANPVKNIYFFTINKSRLSDFIQAYRPVAPSVFDYRYQYMLTTPFVSAGIKINGNYIFDDSFVKLVHENSLINSRSSQSQDIYASTQEESAYMGNIRSDESGSYSFALYPLNNEPSGHLNFSRIIDQKFVINPKFTYVVSNRQLEIPVGDTLELNIHSTSYNMMVYSGGLCGLKY